jgi:hypothetical protein
MADLSEVGDTLKGIIVAAVYPNGTAAPSVGNCDIRVFQGWPDPVQLESDLNASKAQISIFPRPGDHVTAVMAGDGDWQDQSNNGTAGVSIREIRRQTRTFQVTVWANCFDQRDPIAKALDSALGSITRLALLDGSQGVMTYVNSAQDDSLQKQRIYRRDLFYSVNYATTESITTYPVLNTTINVSAGVNLAAAVDIFNPPT